MTLVFVLMAVLFLLCASTGALLVLSELQWKSFAPTLDSDLFFYSIE